MRKIIFACVLCLFLSSKAQACNQFFGFVPTTGFATVGTTNGVFFTPTNAVFTPFFGTTFFTGFHHSNVVNVNVRGGFQRNNVNVNVRVRR